MGSTEAALGEGGTEAALGDSLQSPQALPIQLFTPTWAGPRSAGADPMFCLLYSGWAHPHRQMGPSCLWLSLAL